MRTIHKLSALENHLNKHRHVILIFKSQQCIDCDYLDQFIEDLVAPFQSIEFFSIMRHELAEVFKHFNVYGVPSFLYFIDGELKHTLINKKRKETQDVMAFLQEVIEIKEGYDVF